MHMWTGNIRLSNKASPSIERDAFYSKSQCSGWDLSLDDVTDLLTHQGSSNRRFERNLACLEVHLMWTDYLEFHTGICREIREFNRAQKADSVFWKCIRGLLKSNTKSNIPN